jgi:hypothetical protein
MGRISIRFHRTEREKDHADHAGLLLSHTISHAVLVSSFPKITALLKLEMNYRHVYPIGAFVCMQ